MAATPVNWKNGEDVIIGGSVSDDDAKKKFPRGWKAPKPYIRIVPQPGYAEPNPLERPAMSPDRVQARPRC